MTTLPPSRKEIIPKDVLKAIDRLRKAGPGRELPPPVWYAGTSNAEPTGYITLSPIRDDGDLGEHTTHPDLYSDPKTWQARGSGLAGWWAVAILLGALFVWALAGGAW